MRFLLVCLLLLCALLAPRPAHAQAPDPLPSRLAPPAMPFASPADRAAAAQGEGRSPELLALGGIVGGGVGMFAGMLGGALLDGEPDEDCIDFCFGPGLILGTLAGEALGVAAGVHLANGRRGSLPVGALTSAGILAVGLVAGNDVPEMLVVVPVSQIVAAITVERRTARRR
jgi:hypothetical protein